MYIKCFAQSLARGKHITKASSDVTEVANKKTFYRDGVVMIASHRDVLFHSGD